MSTQMIELIILFAIAAFVLFRLKSVIGTRTGYEAPPDYLTRDRATQPVSTLHQHRGYASGGKKRNGRYCNPLNCDKPFIVG